MFDLLQPFQNNDSMTVRRKVGPSLRRHRLANGLTLKELASRTGLSASFLSQVEREACSISILSLEKVCSALGIATGALIEGIEDHDESHRDASPVVRAGQELQLRIGEHPVTYRHLTTRIPSRRLEALIHEIPSGHTPELGSHAGEEFGYVLEGTLILILENERYLVHAGDSYHFNALRKHGYGTPPESNAIVLAVSTQRFVDWHSGAMHINRLHVQGASEKGPEC